MTFALMLGCPMPKNPKGLAWTEGTEEKRGDKYTEVPWIFEGFRPGRGPEMDHDEEGEVLGIYIAAGASGKDGVPDLEGPIDLVAIEHEGPYTKRCAAARKQWDRYAAFAAVKGHVLPVPRLFLVETEVG